MKTLIIDTSHNYLVVALAENGIILKSFQENIQKKHSELLLVTIESFMNELAWNPLELDEVVVTDGPGSYTGMRIGITFVKTYGIVNPSINVYTVDTLASLVGNQEGFAILDARSNRVFGACINNGVVTDEKIYTLEELSSLEDQVFGDAHLLNQTQSNFGNIAQNILDIKNSWTLVENVDTLVPRYIK